MNELTKTVNENFLSNATFPVGRRNVGVLYALFVLVLSLYHGCSMGADGHGVIKFVLFILVIFIIYRLFLLF